MNIKKEDKITYGQLLLEYRAKNKLTQSGLAEILGIHINMVGRYEKGISYPSRVNKLRFEKKMREWECKK